MTNSPDQQFLEQIARNPGDTKLRLIYADWLGEHGDPRGEFIRLFHAMQGLPVWSDRYQQLKGQRTRLRVEVDRAWATQLGYQPVYQPLFTELPSSLSARLLLLDEYLEFWLPDAVDAQRAESQIHEFEDSTGHCLPAFCHEYYLRVIPHHYEFDTNFDLQHASVSDGIVSFSYPDYGRDNERGGEPNEFGFELSSEDPLVLWRNYFKWENTGERLSTFLLKGLYRGVRSKGKPFYLFPIRYASFLPIQYRPRLDEPRQKHMDEVRQKLVKCDWKQEWDKKDTEFLEGADMIAIIAADMLQITTRTDAALDIFSPSLRNALVEPK